MNSILLQLGVKPQSLLRNDAACHSIDPESTDEASEGAEDCVPTYRPQTYSSCFGLPYQDHNYGAPPPPTPPASPPPAAKVNGHIDIDNVSCHTVVTTSNDDSGIINTDDSITRCVCDFEHDDGYMICCDKCGVWQHVDCMGVNRNNIPDIYLCEVCEPRKVDKRRAVQLQKKRRELLARLAAADSSSTETEDETSQGRNKKKVPARKKKDKKDFARNKKGKKGKVVKENKTEITPIKKKRRLAPPKRLLIPTPSPIKELRTSPCDVLPQAEVREQWDDTTGADTYEEAHGNQYSCEIEDLLAAGRFNGQGGNFADSKLDEQLRVQLCRVAQVNANSKGLEATDDLECGRPLIEYKGRVALKEEYDKENMFFKRLQPFVLFYPELESFDFCIDASSFGNRARFVRRSCFPNSEVRHVFDSGHLRFIIFSLKFIMKGEEVTIPFDYNFEECSYPVECACSRSNCAVVRFYKRENPQTPKPGRRRKRSHKSSEDRSYKSTEEKLPPDESKSPQASKPPPSATPPSSPVKSPVAKQRRLSQSPVAKQRRPSSSPVAKQRRLSMSPIRNSTPPTPVSLPSPPPRKQEEVNTTISLPSPVKEEPEEAEEPEPVPEDTPLSPPPAQDEPMEQETDDHSEEKGKKMTREERKMEAIIKAFERLEKREERRKEALARLGPVKKEKVKDVKPVKEVKVVEPKEKEVKVVKEVKVEPKEEPPPEPPPPPPKKEEPATVKVFNLRSAAREEEKLKEEKEKETSNSEETEKKLEKTPKKSIKKKKPTTPARRRSRASSRLSNKSAKTDTTDSMSGEETVTNTPATTPIILPITQTPSSSTEPNSAVTTPSTAVSEKAFKFPKTKKHLMNEWLQEKEQEALKPLAVKTEPVDVRTEEEADFVKCVPSPHASSLSHLRRNSSSGNTTPRRTSISSCSSTNRNYTPVGTPNESNMGSAKKRWLRQAMFENTGQPNQFASGSLSPVANEALSPNPHSGSEAPVASAYLDFVTPLKKRRFARESLSTETPYSSTPSTPTAQTTYAEGTDASDSERSEKGYSDTERYHETAKVRLAEAVLLKNGLRPHSSPIRSLAMGENIFEKLGRVEEVKIEADSVKQEAVEIGLHFNLSVERECGLAEEAVRVENAEVDGHQSSAPILPANTGRNCSQPISDTAIEESSACSDVCRHNTSDSAVEDCGNSSTAEESAECSQLSPLKCKARTSSCVAQSDSAEYASDVRTDCAQNYLYVESSKTELQLVSSGTSVCEATVRDSSVQGCDKGHMCDSTSSREDVVKDTMVCVSCSDNKTVSASEETVSASVSEQACSKEDNVDSSELPRGKYQSENTERTCSSSTASDRDVSHPEAADPVQSASSCPDPAVLSSEDKVEESYSPVESSESFTEPGVSSLGIEVESTGLCVSDSSQEKDTSGVVKVTSTAMEASSVELRAEPLHGIDSSAVPSSEELEEEDPLVSSGLTEVPSEPCQTGAEAYEMVTSGEEVVSCSTISGGGSMKASQIIEKVVEEKEEGEITDDDEEVEALVTNSAISCKSEQPRSSGDSPVVSSSPHASSSYRRDSSETSRSISPYNTKLPYKFKSAWKDRDYMYRYHHKGSISSDSRSDRNSRGSRYEQSSPHRDREELRVDSTSEDVDKNGDYMCNVSNSDCSRGSSGMGEAVDSSGSFDGITSPSSTWGSFMTSHAAIKKKVSLLEYRKRMKSKGPESSSGGSSKRSSSSSGSSTPTAKDTAVGLAPLPMFDLTLNTAALPGRKQDEDVRWNASATSAERMRELSLTERLRREFGVDASESDDDDKKKDDGLEPPPPPPPGHPPGYCPPVAVGMIQGAPLPGMINISTGMCPVPGQPPVQLVSVSSQQQGVVYPPPVNQGQPLISPGQVTLVAPNTAQPTIILGAPAQPMDSAQHRPPMQGQCQLRPPLQGQQPRPVHGQPQHRPPIQGQPPASNSQLPQSSRQGYMSGPMQPPPFPSPSLLQSPQSVPPSGLLHSPQPPLPPPGGAHLPSSQPVSSHLPAPQPVPPPPPTGTSGVAPGLPAPMRPSAMLPLPPSHQTAPQTVTTSMSSAGLLPNTGQPAVVTSHAPQTRPAALLLTPPIHHQLPHRSPGPAMRPGLLGAPPSNGVTQPHNTIQPHLVAHRPTLNAPPSAVRPSAVDSSIHFPPSTLHAPQPPRPLRNANPAGMEPSQSHSRLPSAGPPAGQHFMPSATGQSQEFNHPAPQQSSEDQSNSNLVSSLPRGAGPSQMHVAPSHRTHAGPSGEHSLLGQPPPDRAANSGGGLLATPGNLIPPPVQDTQEPPHTIPSLMSVHSFPTPQFRKNMLGESGQQQQRSQGPNSSPGPSSKGGTVSGPISPAVTAPPYGGAPQRTMSAPSPANTAPPYPGAQPRTAFPPSTNHATGYPPQNQFTYSHNIVHYDYNQSDGPKH